MFTIKAVIRDDQKNKNGKSPIYFRITQNRKSKFISIGIDIEPKFWDSQKSKVKFNHQNNIEINHYLSVKEQEIIERLQTKNKDFDDNIRQVKNELFDKQSIDFFEYSNKLIESYALKGYQKDKNIKDAIKKLKNYVQKDVLYFNEIDFSFVNKYLNHLKTINTNSTIKHHFIYLKMIMKKAIIDNIIPDTTASNPFEKFKIKANNSERLFLDELEIVALSNLKLEDKEEIARDMFVFCCYCGGIRVSDLISLKVKNFDGSHIEFTSKKTKTPQRFKVPSKAIEIINKYSEKESNSEHYLFPLLKKEFDDNHTRAFLKDNYRLIASLNKNLKTICIKANVNKKISFHCSRHTFATIALGKGISIDKVSNILGHSSIVTTQIYAKIVNADVDKAMELFNT